MTLRGKAWVLAVSLLSAPLANAAQGQGPDAADIWTEAKIVTSYTLDTALNPFDIEVEVIDGKVFLAGTLPSADARARAERLARAVDGVTDVDNGIVLDRHVPHNQARFDTDRSGTDANITAMVKAQLLWNRLTHAHDISVSTNDGVVTLTGSVASEQEAREIARIASSTRMVDRINNRLQVAP